MTQAEWLECKDSLKMLDFLKDRVSKRKLRLFACACCRRIWHLLRDQRSRDAVAGSERFADKLIKRQELIASHQEAMFGKKSFDYYVYPAENAAASVACPSIKIPWILWLTEAALGNQAVSTRGGISAAVNLPLREEVRQKEGGAQMNLLHDIAGNPFHSVTLDSSWLTANVVNLAQAIYDDRAFDQLPILADALEEAGCTDADIFDHCRSGGPHIRGCWVMDTVLGKE